MLLDGYKNMKSKDRQEIEKYILEIFRKKINEVIENGRCNKLSNLEILLAVDETVDKLIDTLSSDVDFDLDMLDEIVKLKSSIIKDVRVDIASKTQNIMMNSSDSVNAVGKYLNSLKEKGIDLSFKGMTKYISNLISKINEKKAEAKKHDEQPEYQAYNPNDSYDYYNDSYDDDYVGSCGHTRGCSY